MIESFPLPKDLRQDAVSPASEHLYQVDDKASKIDSEHADIFHTIVVKGLFLTL